MIPKILILLLVCISLTAAFPLQLLQNGTIIDLGTNETINGTQVDFVYYNDTLYLVPKANTTYITYNITNVTNVTNISYGNLSNYTTFNITNCTNCSYNYTYYNATGNYTYTKSEIDSKITGYLTTSSLTPYALKTDFSPYALKTELPTSLNSTLLDKKISEKTFWISIGIIVFLLIVLTFMIVYRE